MRIGENVVLSNEEPKIIYTVKNIEGNLLTISGLNYRIIKQVSISDLIKAPAELVEKEEKETQKIYYNVTNNVRHSKERYLLGTVLHIDGDKTYLNKCLKLYEEVGIFAYGVNVNESKMSDYIPQVLSEVRPDIIVLTGHDSYNQKGLMDLKNYNNSENFMNTIRKIRNIRSSLDCCVIAGACQSNFEALIASGANFASSPKRINIHTYDPAVVAIKVATTSFLKIVNFSDMLKYIKGGREAFGGVETLGKMKLLL